MGLKSILLKFDIAKQTWDVKKTPFEIPYYSAAVTLENGEILLVGGCLVTSVYKYNPYTSNLLLQIRLKLRHHCHAAGKSMLLSD